EERSASALRDFDCSDTSLTIVRKTLRDEPRRFLRVRMARRRGRRIFDHPPLAARADLAEPADHERLHAIDEREVAAAAERARVTARHRPRRGRRIGGLTTRNLARPRHV